MTRKNVFLLTGSALVLLSIASVWFFRAQSSMQSIRDQIQTDYQDIKHMSPEALLSLTSSSSVVFDVREAHEFQVSSIKDAIHVPPDIDTQVFLERYRDLMAGKNAVFYCSVGKRSSDLARRIQEAEPTFKVFNLDGGLFHWVNQQYPVSGNGIHPYNDFWSKYIDNKDIIRYQR